MSEELRRMSIKEALAIGNEGIESMMASERKIDYLGLIAFLLGQEKSAQNLVDRLIEKNIKLRESLADLTADRMPGVEAEPVLLTLPLEEQLEDLLETDGAPKIAVLAVLKYLEKIAV